MTYEQICNYIEEIPKFTKKNGLDHTRLFLSYLGDPQDNMQVIHVAGSNGKGSVCKAISQMLVRSGYKTGLFISPHLVYIEERFCIQNEICDRKTFVNAFQKVKDVVDQMQTDGYVHPSFFEFLFGMAFVIFQLKGIEVAVLETGLGGRLDATNVITKPLFTVITSISLEHTDILGDTIEKIAFEKAGIIKEKVPVFVDGTNETAVRVIEARAKEKKAPIKVLWPNSYNILKNTGKRIDFSLCCRYDECVTLQIPFVAEYQVANLSLAYFAMVQMKDVLQIQVQDLKDELSKISWPGRMQEIMPDVFLDGAHNVSGITEFIKTVRTIGGHKPILMFSMVKDKDYKNAIHLLAMEDWDQIILTQMKDKRGLQLEELKNEFTEKGKNVFLIDDCKNAFQKALEIKQTGQKLFCTGSLYFIGEIEEILGGMKHD